MGSEALTLKQALKLYYPAGTHIATIHRHVVHGGRTRSGTVVKLEATRLERRWTTTAQAVERFRDRCTSESGGQAPAPPRREAEKARAKAFLDAIGVR